VIKGKKLEPKIIKIDPLGSRLDKAGFKGGASRNYAKFLSKQAKSKIDKTISKKDNKSGFGSLKRKQFKGARGAPLSVKKKLVKIEKLKQQNQKNLENPSVIDRQMTGTPFRKEYPQALENKMKNTRIKLNKLEKDVKAKYRKTDTYKNLDFKSKGGLIRKPKLAKRGF
tara:strand:+ start:415 stop:921 length:507 start_codon:yes stop_codon:yes gene_type:complete